MPDRFPTVAVEVAWADAPSEAGALTWYDVAGWRAIDVTRGRQRELETFSPGSATVVASDTDRQLDPTNAAATHAGNLLPMRRVRVRATFDGVEHHIFHGFLDAFSHAYAGPHDADVTATLEATDGFKVLAATELPSSAYVLEVAADGPAAWWRLGEAEGATVAYDSIGAFDLTVAGYTEAPTDRPTFGVDGLVSRDDDTAWEITAANTAKGAHRRGSPIAGNPVSVEILFQGTGSNGTLAGQQNTAATEGWSLQVSAAGKATFTAGTGGTFATATSTVTVNDGLPHHIAGVWETSGSVRIYVDGVDSTTTPASATAAAYSGTHTMIVGGGDAFGPNYTILGVAGVYDEPAVYGTALSAARVAAHAEARATPWRADTPAARITRVLDHVAWRADQRDLDTGTSTLQSADIAGRSALDHLERVAASDYGVVFIAGDGDLTFLSRATLWARTAAATFGDDPADTAELGYWNPRPEYTDALIRNDVTVSRAEGVAQHYEDTASVAAYLRHSHVIDGLIHDDDLLSRAIAEYVASEYAQPRRRISALTIRPLGNPTVLFPQVLGRELGDVITVIDRPAGGTANQADYAIEGVAHTVTPGGWETTWSLSPMWPTGVAVARWDVGLWDTDRWGF